jgi:hypothetical protein
VKRERVAESWELQKIQKPLTGGMARSHSRASNRNAESKLIDIHEEWLVQQGMDCGSPRRLDGVQQTRYEGHSTQ